MKRFFKVTLLISAICVSFSINVFAEGDDTDDNSCPDDGGAVITCGKYEGPCWEIDWISPILYVHCRFSGYMKDYCIEK